MEIEDLMEDYYRTKHEKIWRLLKTFTNKNFHLRNLRFLSRTIYSNDVCSQHLAVIGLMKILKSSEKSKPFQKKFIIKFFFQSNVLPRLMEFLLNPTFPYLQFVSLNMISILLKFKSAKRLSNIISFGAIYGLLSSLSSKYAGIARQVTILCYLYKLILFFFFKASICLLTITNNDQKSFCDTIVNHGGIIDLIKFIEITNDKTGFNFCFLTLVNLCCDASFDLVSEQIPTLVDFAFKQEENPEVFSAAMHVLSILTDLSLVQDHRYKTFKSMLEFGFLEKMSTFLKYFYFLKNLFQNLKNKLVFITCDFKHFENFH